MHQGKPYGLHVVGKPLTEKDEAFVSATALRFTNLKSVSNIDTLKMVYELPDGGSFIIQDAGGNFRVIAHKPIIDQEQPKFDGLARSTVPMLFSGAIVGNAILREDQGLSMNLSLQTRKRVLGYINGYAPKNVRLMRFACKYGALFQEFMPEQPISNVVYTQYLQQRPTWYSGAMSEVMQIVGGYGKQELNKLPDDKLERATFTMPPRFQSRIEKDIELIRLPCYTGLPNEDGEFQCDYKAFNTNAVSFDSNNKPWLIKIDSSGVWAMPLPIIPASATQAFRDYIDGMGDTEILAILDRFGAMPSGESFPLSSSAFQAWRRAGVIIRICDTKDFYKNRPYSSAMGWSANTSGTELVNTCYNIDDVTGKITSLAYKIRLRLGATDNNGWIKARTGTALINMGHINKYLQSIYDLITENTPINLAIKYKINKTSLIEIGTRARLYGGQSEVDYWNNLESKPIAIHEGTLTKIDEGIYFGGYEVKVPEPILRGCISIPVPLPTVTDRKGKKDTIVLAYYIEDSLKTVRLFADDRPQQYEVDTNFETYMYAGKWYKRELAGAAFIKGNLYTSDIDDRFIAAPTEIETDVEGKDLGYGLPEWRFNFYFWRLGNIERRRYYSTNTNKKTSTDKSIRLATTIPYYCRNTLIYASIKESGVVRYDESLTLNSVRDPYYYDMWTYHKDFAYFGENNPSNGTPFPIDGYPVHAEKQYYEPSEANAFADEGPWIDAVPTDISSIMYSYNPAKVWQIAPNIPQPKLDIYSKSNTVVSTSEKKLQCQIYDRVEKIRDGEHDDFYYYLSPYDGQIVFYRDACKVVFGDKRYANISETTEAGNRKQWGESTLVNNKSAHHFIGVINE